MARTFKRPAEKALTEYQVTMESIKAILKRQKITYRDLAKQLKLSESGIKKIMGAEDGSFQRVVDICGVLGLSVSELLAGRNEAARELSYSDEQQDYFLKNPRAFALFWLMAYERRNLEAALQAAGIGEKDRFPTLRKLDQLKLLELLPGDRVRVPSVQQVRWVGGGPLVAKIYREWSQQFMKDVAKPEADVPESERAHQLFLIRYFKASPKTFSEMCEALRDIEAEFLRRGVQDMRTEAPDLMHVRWISAVDNRSFWDGSR